MWLVHKIRYLGMKIQILNKRQSISIERWLITKPIDNGLTKIIRTLGKGIKVETTIEIIITISTGIKIGVKIKMVIRRKHDYKDKSDLYVPPKN